MAETRTHRLRFRISGGEDHEDLRKEIVLVPGGGTIEPVLHRYMLLVFVSE